MIVIAKDAERKLLDELQKHKQDLSQMKCLFIQFSKSDADKKKLFDHFLTIIETVPQSYTAEVYICEDHDVFVLLHSFMESAFDEAIKELSVTLETTFQSQRFLIDEDHQTIEDLCRRKEALIERSEGTDHDFVKGMETVKDILSVLEISMAETLARRRQTRREPMVLIIEDDQLARTLVTSTLRQDFEPITADKGLDGLKLYLEHAPDVVFLDIGLPDINGHDVLQCIFKMDSDAYVIMFSGRKDKENIMRALKAGAQGFIGKPFTREKLFEYIRKSPYIEQKMPHFKDEKTA